MGGQMQNVRRMGLEQRFFCRLFRGEVAQSLDERTAVMRSTDLPTLARSRIPFLRTGPRL
jgi:hypothetical protein